MSVDTRQPDFTIDALVDEYRNQCLWFLREDFYPTTIDEKLRVLKYIQRYGDRTAYRKAAETRRWLLQAPTKRLPSASSQSYRVWRGLSRGRCDPQ